MKKLEDALREIPSDDDNWRDKVENLKRQVAEEKSNSIRYIIKYNKYYIDLDNQNTLGLFRSVISDGTNIISFAPPKSLSYKLFETKTASENRQFLEYCEGTMINMYFDTKLGEWETCHA